MRMRAGRSRLLSAVLACALAAVACSSDSRVALDRAVEQATGPGTDATNPVEGPADDTRQSGLFPESDPTPLPVDRDLTMGTLDNGLTYYVRSNAAPGTSLELRLVVDAGSALEPEPGRGIAHFVEHMLFNGTESFPGNELDSVLRNLGAEIGPDFNAYTSYDETVYGLTITVTDERAAQTGFEILREWASAALIDPEAVAAERGVVREELRERTETGAGYIVSEFDRVYTEGTPYDGFDPIGTAASIEAMGEADLRAFYDAWYRPDNMAVVAVGDLPVETLERLVVENFAALEPRAPTPTRAAVDESVLSPRPRMDVFTHPDEASPYLSVDIPIHTWDASTVGGDRLLLMEQLIVEMVRNRLGVAHARGELAQDTIPSFLTFDWARHLRFYGTNLQAPDLAVALTAYMSELETIVAHGFTVADLVRAAETVEAGLDLVLDSRATTQDHDHAETYVAHFLRGADISDVDQAARRTRALLLGIDVDELSDHFRWQMSESAPVVIAVGPDVYSVPTVAELEAALAAVEAGPPAEPVPLIDELMASPDGVDPIATNTLLFSGAAEWVFENGARVVFVESDISDGAVELWATSSGGWSTLAPGDAAVAPLATSAVGLSGLGEHDRATVDRFLAGSTAWIEPYIDEIDEGFYGGGATGDLVTLFQLLHLLVTGPRVDPAGLAQALSTGRATIGASMTDPAFRTFLAFDDARYGSDGWHVSVPTEAQLEGLTADTALDLYERRLGSVDDLVVAVAGDVDVQVVGLMAERYVGTLPAGAADAHVDVLPPPPAGIVSRQVLLDDDVTAAGLLIGHEVETEVDPSVEVTARVLETIVNSRLFLSIREGLGASYGGYVSVTPSHLPRPRVQSLVEASGDPARLDLIHTTVLETLHTLAADGPTRAELEEARAVVGNDYSFTSNQEILDLLVRQTTGQGDDIPWPDVRFAELQALTTEQVRDLAAALYTGDRRVEVMRTLG